MSYWIFVHTGKEANRTFLKMIEKEKNWGFETTQPIRNKINVIFPRKSGHKEELVLA